MTSIGEIRGHGVESEGVLASEPVGGRSRVAELPCCIRTILHAFINRLY